MSSIKLPHSSGNSMSIAAPATNPASDLTLQLPNSIGTGKINHSNILEQFYSPCDGSSITVPSGTYTLTNVTAAQNLTTTHADITGSSISYTPPAGTTQVIYEFQFAAGPGDAEPVMHYKFNVDGTDVTYSRHSTYVGATEVFNHFKWAVNIGGSTTAATGRLASWSGAKTLKMMAREYGGSNEGTVHQVHHWDGATPSIFHQPCIGITAIGTPA